MTSHSRSMAGKLGRPHIRSWQKRGFNRVLEFLRFLTCERWLPAACGCAVNAERLAQQLLKCGRELAKQRKKYSEAKRRVRLLEELASESGRRHGTRLRLMS